ncbi:MAG: DUF5711 family protein, partial [Eubacterium sp.]|nr:DUF5711 family protein [Eubacterium sp.]
YIAVVTADDSLKKKELEVFLPTGEPVLECPISYDYSEFRIYGEELYFYSGHHIDIVRINGDPKFSCDFDTEITGVFPGNKSIEYILVDHNSIQRIRMKTR